MKRKAYGRDFGLTARMLLTSFLLGLLYVLFAVVLFSVLNVGLYFGIIIIGGLAFFQYFTSDKLALRASGAKIVEPDEAPELHAMIERLCGDGGPAQAASRDRRHAGPERLRDRPQPEARGRRGHDTVSGTGSTRRRSRASSRTS